MQEISVNKIKTVVCEMLISCNHTLSPDMETAVKDAQKKETSLVAKEVLDRLLENLLIARTDMIPICQDTGMAVIFIRLGQDVKMIDGSLTDAINEGVRMAYEDGYLRKSVVQDPLIRKNTRDNTPAIIHYDVVSGDKIEITVAPKGAGSENMSRIFMLKPAQGLAGVTDSVLTAIKEAGPNACPPMVVGVGIGGNFEKCALLAKKALIRPVGIFSELPHIRQLEESLKRSANELMIGAAGLGGDTTVFAVHVETYPTHIACLPVAVNICCHVNRHRTTIL